MVQLSLAFNASKNCRLRGADSMSSQFSVKKLRHRPRHPTQVEAHAVFRKRKIRWAFVEAAWVAIGCSAYFGDFYKRKRALGKKPSLAIRATARLMARITWQLLTQRRAYTSLVETQYLRSQLAERIARAGDLAKEVHKPLKDPSDLPRRRLSPAAPE